MRWPKTKQANSSETKVSSPFAVSAFDLLCLWAVGMTNCSYNAVLILS